MNNRKVFFQIKRKRVKIDLCGSLPAMGIRGCTETKIIGICVSLQWRYGNSTNLENNDISFYCEILIRGTKRSKEWSKPYTRWFLSGGLQIIKYKNK